MARANSTRQQVPCEPGEKSIIATIRFRGRKAKLATSQTRVSRKRLVAALRCFIDGGVAWKADTNSR